MAALAEDVVREITFTLFEMRQGLLEDAFNKTPIELIDAAITGTVSRLGEQFQLQSIPSCESNGDPHYSSPQDVIKHYWDIVNDDGEDE